MPRSKVEIVNIALARLGEGMISSLTEDSATAKAANLIYDEARQAALRDYNWGFALRTASLAQVDESAPDYEYVYALPSNCLRVIRVQGEIPYEVRGHYLVCDASSVVLEYVEDVEDTYLFDAQFTEALTYKLASDLAQPVKGSSELMTSYANAYANLASLAAADSAKEHRDRTELEGYDYITARY